MSGLVKNGAIQIQDEIPGMVAVTTSLRIPPGGKSTLFGLSRSSRASRLSSTIFSLGL